MEKLREYLLEGLREEVRDGASYAGWSEMVKGIAEQIQKLEDAKTVEELKKIAIEDILWEEEDLEDVIERLNKEE
jgi:hypothetical protein